MGAVIQYSSVSIDVTCHKSNFIFRQLKQHLSNISFDDEWMLQNVHIPKFKFAFEGRKVPNVIDFKSNSSWINRKLAVNFIWFEILILF